MKITARLKKSSPYSWRTGLIAGALLTATPLTVASANALTADQPTPSTARTAVANTPAQGKILLEAKNLTPGDSTLYRIPLRTLTNLKGAKTYKVATVVNNLSKATADGNLSDGKALAKNLTTTFFYAQAKGDEACSFSDPGKSHPLPWARRSGAKNGVHKSVTPKAVGLNRAKTLCAALSLDLDTPSTVQDASLDLTLLFTPGKSGKR